MTTAPWPTPRPSCWPSATPGARRAPLLEPADEPLPELWGELVALGWLGLHLPEDVGGSGYGLEELVVVVEELGRAVAPGPFVPTVIASAVLDATADEATRARPAPAAWPTARSSAGSRSTPR